MSTNSHERMIFIYREDVDAAYQSIREIATEKELGLRRNQMENANGVEDAT